MASMHEVVSAGLYEVGRRIFNLFHLAQSTPLSLPRERSKSVDLIGGEKGEDIIPSRYTPSSLENLWRDIRYAGFYVSYVPTLR